MEIPIATNNWLPVLLVSNSDFVTPITDVAFDATGLVVSYLKEGGSVTTLPLTSDNWVEADDGIYKAQFPAAACNAVGLFMYWVTLPAAVIYPGAVRVFIPETGEGAKTFVYTLSESGGIPIADAEVWVTSDEAGEHIVAGSQRSSVMGVTTWYLDPADYYFWSQKAGYNFDNPDKETVS